jgi:hypothetical protein
MHELGMLHLPGVPPVFPWPLGEYRRDQREERGEKADFEDADFTAEAFDDGVSARIERIRQERKNDAEGHRDESEGEEHQYCEL